MAERSVSLLSLRDKVNDIAHVLAGENSIYAVYQRG